MSDRLMSGLNRIAGDSLAQTGTYKALAPAPSGKPASPPGNPLPPAGAPKPRVGHELRFIVDLESSRPVIQVLDSETGEVIRQIPAEKISDYASSGNALSVRLLDTLA